MCITPAFSKKRTNSRGDFFFSGKNDLVTLHLLVKTEFVKRKKLQCDKENNAHFLMSVLY